MKLLILLCSQQAVLSFFASAPAPIPNLNCFCPPCQDPFTQCQPCPETKCSSLLSTSYAVDTSPAIYYFSQPETAPYVGPAMEVPAASPVLWSPPRLWSPELPPRASRRPPLKVFGSNRTTLSSPQKALTYAKTHKSRYFHVSRIPNAEADPSHTTSPSPSLSRSDSSSRSEHVSEPPDVAQTPHSLGERQLNIAVSFTPPTKPDEVPRPTSLPESPLDDFFMLEEGTNSSQAPELTRTTYSRAGHGQLNSQVTPSAAEIFTEVRTMEASELSTSAPSPPVYVDASNIEINSPELEMGAGLSNNASASRNSSSTDDRDEIDSTSSPDLQDSSPAQTVLPPYHLSYVQRDLDNHIEQMINIRPKQFWKDGIRKLADRWQQGHGP